MLRVGLTGGIAAGKSLAASTLRELGAVVIDSDVLARAVVEPGTDGLREVAEAFGPEILQPDGSLNRAALGSRVFADPAGRTTLNGIIHPRVRQLAAEAEAAAEAASAGAVVVHDIPLLVETGQEDRFHLVLVIDAPEELRVRRMEKTRGLSTQEAWNRIRAQADTPARNAAADVVLDNSGGTDSLVSALTSLWFERITPYAENLRLQRVAGRPGGPVLVEDAGWPREAELLSRRLRRVDARVLDVHHIGSTSVPGLPAKDVIDLQLTVNSLDEADAIASALAAAGFPRYPGVWRDEPKPDDPGPAVWAKRLHANADPGRPVNVHVRAKGSPGWRWALSFADWLRADPEMAQAYLADKLRCVRLHADDDGPAGYTLCKEAWFTDTADPLLRRWIADTGWTPPG